MNMFSKGDVDSTIKDYEKKSNRLPEIPPGGYTLTVTDVELKYSKQSKNPMIVFEMSLDDKHAPIRNNAMLKGPGSDVAKRILVEFLFSAFSYKMKPAEDEHAVFSQLQKFKGEKLKVAVQGRQVLIQTKNDKGEDVLEIQTRSDYWYAGNVNDKKFSVNQSKLIKELDKKDKQKLARFSELKTDGAEVAAEMGDTDFGGSDSDIDTSKAEEPKSEEPEVPENDDLPF